MFVVPSAAAANAESNDYIDGGIQRRIYGPSDEGGRVISMKLYCDTDESGSTYDMLGIFDVTEPHNIYGQNISLGSFDYSAGKLRFALDDRTPGHRNYVLAISPRGDSLVTFGRPGNEDQISTSLTKLLRLRAQYAIDQGFRVTIGSEDFLIIPQRGSLTGFVFFKGDLAQRLANGDIDAAYGKFCVKTERRTEAGRWVRERGPLPIGNVDGVFYEMAYDPQSNQWVIQRGPPR